MTDKTVCVPTSALEWMRKRYPDLLKNSGLAARPATEYVAVPRALSLRPDPHMEWIYRPKFRDDPKARNLRRRREYAFRSCPRWMVEDAQASDNLRAALAALSSPPAQSTGERA